MDDPLTLNPLISVARKVFYDMEMEPDRSPDYIPII
jgi:hypothetical protein